MKKALALTLILIAVSCSSNPPKNQISATDNPKIGTEDFEIWKNAHYVALITTGYKSKVGSDSEGRMAGFLWTHGNVNYIVTAGHIIPNDYESNKNLFDFRVSFRDNPEASYSMRLINWSRDPDLALFVITDQNFRFSWPLPKLGDVPKAGEWVYSLGHPFGLSYAISAAKIFAPSCVFSEFKTPLLCHLPALNINDLHVGSGSSGGPILNQGGEIIGMHVGAISNLEIDGKPAIFGLAVPSKEILENILVWIDKK